MTQITNGSAKKSVFWACLAAMTWMALKENPKGLKDPVKICRGLFDKLSLHKAFISLPDKQQQFEKFAVFLKEKLLPNGQLQDSLFVKFITQSLKNQGQETVVGFFRTLADGVVADRRISAQEKECLYILGDQYNIGREQIEGLLQKGKATMAKGGAHHTSERIVKRSEKLVGAVAIAVALILVAGLGLLGWEYVKASRELQPARVAKALENSPTLVVKRVHFKKYVAYGRPDGVNKHFEKLSIFLVSGYADFQFDLSRLSMDEEKSDQITRVLALSYKKGPMPLQVKVTIPEGSAVRIETLDGEPISEELAGEVAAGMAVPAGIVGGIVGDKVGAFIKTSIPGLGRVVAASVGTAAAGTVAFVYTKNFLTGLKLVDAKMSEDDQLIHSAKQLIALELMGGNLLDKAEWKEAIPSKWQAEFELAMADMFKGLGWRKVNVTYN